ncbi:efflux RND transporter periplasmic adaptor subunit [Ramlibacter sp. AW1]|uniref:Efflux RND transporter periplasmic adaptor subunit n=1 Tax=Ramlibacter aurantiacus TaxID=2801330 RepID=A0A937D2K0_9BURK|nr:efflux RND transporter periplasmic adaptor subunit [Ramlibacter aurantiacus]MBL0419810.1 efflux RND transporter periplasmic adaptor subunit [Ramlibacter aurantiacus]
MASRSLYVVVAVVGIAAASGAAWWYQNKNMRGASTVAAEAPPSRGPGAAGAGGSTQGAPRSPSVEVARVELANLVDEAQAVGTLRSRQSVMLRPEVSGRVAQIHFRDGERVRRGQLLVQFDDELPRAQIQQAQAELSIVQANHKRNQELVTQGFISQRSVDESGAALQVAQAKLALAKAQADRLRLVAPFDGTTGIRNVHVGDYLKDGADIVNLEDLDAILVDFRLPERFQAKVRPGQSAMVSLDALPGERHVARVQAIDPLVDANGRSVGVRACIDNRRQQLRPGMFARVTAVFSERSNVRVIPEEALVPQGARQIVWRLVDGPDQEAKLAQRVEVQVGVRQPGRVEIVAGLEAGDTVVVAGHQRIQRDNTPVRVVDLARPGGEGRRGPGGPGGRGGGDGLGPAAAAANGPAALGAAPGRTAGNGPAERGAAAARVAGAGPAPAPGRPGTRAATGPNPCLVASAAPAR